MPAFRRGTLAFLCLLSTQVFASGAPTIYVSTGTAGKIYGVDTTTSQVSLLLSSAVPVDYEGMVVAPDNTVQVVGDSTTHSLVYVCDTANNKVIRFDPAAPTTRQDVIYSGGALQHPQCGRITSTGDLVVSSTNAGAGLWIFSGVTNWAINAGTVTPQQLVGVAGSSEGLAQKNTGDLLVIDSTNNQVRRAPTAVSASTNPFITSGLSQPFGIARRGDGDLFVSNQGQGQHNVVHFDAQGTNPTTCQALVNDMPNFMQMALDNTLYLAITGAGGKLGSVRAINAANCQQTQTFAIPFPAIGIALSPNMTATQAVTAANGTALVNFGFAAFELNQIVGNCGGTVGVGLASPAALDTLINLSGVPADPAVNLALDGFEAVFSTANLQGCQAADQATNNFQMSDFLALSVTNPETVVCDDANSVCTPGNVNLLQIAAWPIGGYLPKDLTSAASKSLRCNVFMVNARPQRNAPGQELGTFCGFESPVSDTYSPALGTWNASSASTFKPGKSVPVKFKLGAGAPSNCHSPLIKDAIALLSVAEIADSGGNPTFVTIGLVSNGSSGLAQPLFKADSNAQYLFNWDTSSCIMPSGVTQVCPSGTYSLTVVFLTNNTTQQTIYDTQTTLVVLK